MRMSPIDTDVDATASGGAAHRRWMLAPSAALAAAYWLIGMVATALFPFAGGVAVESTEEGKPKPALRNLPWAFLRWVGRIIRSGMVGIGVVVVLGEVESEQRREAILRQVSESFPGKQVRSEIVLIPVGTPGEPEDVS